MDFELDVGDLESITERLLADRDAARDECDPPAVAPASAPPPAASFPEPRAESQPAVPGSQVVGTAVAASVPAGICGVECDSGHDSGRVQVAAVAAVLQEPGPQVPQRAVSGSGGGGPVVGAPPLVSRPLLDVSAATVAVASRGGGSSGGGGAGGPKSGGHLNVGGCGSDAEFELSEDEEDDGPPLQRNPSCKACSMVHPTGLKPCPLFEHLPASVMYKCAVPIGCGSLPDPSLFKVCSACRRQHIDVGVPLKDQQCPVIRYGRTYQKELDLCFSRRGPDALAWCPLDWRERYRPPKVQCHNVGFVAALSRVEQPRAGAPSDGVDSMWMSLQCLVASRGLACAIAAKNDHDMSLLHTSRYAKDEWRELLGDGCPRPTVPTLTAESCAVVVLGRLLWLGVDAVWATGLVASQSEYTKKALAAVDGKRFGSVFWKKVTELTNAYVGCNPSSRVGHAPSMAATLLYHVSGLKRTPNSQEPFVSLPSDPLGDSCFGECWWVFNVAFSCGASHHDHVSKVGRASTGKQGAVYEGIVTCAMLDIHVEASAIRNLGHASILACLRNSVVGKPYACPWCPTRSARQASVAAASPIDLIYSPPTAIFTVVGSFSPSDDRTVLPTFFCGQMVYRLVGALFTDGDTQALCRAMGDTPRVQYLVAVSSPDKPTAWEAGLQLPDAYGFMSKCHPGLIPKLLVYETTPESRLRAMSLFEVGPKFQPQYVGGCGSRQLLTSLCPFLMPGAQDNRVIAWRRTWSTSEQAVIREVCRQGRAGPGPGLVLVCLCVCVCVCVCVWFG